MIIDHSKQWSFQSSNLGAQSIHLRSKFPAIRRYRELRPRWTSRRIHVWREIFWFTFHKLLLLLNNFKFYKYIFIYWVFFIIIFKMYNEFFKFVKLNYVGISNVAALQIIPASDTSLTKKRTFQNSPMSE